MPEDIRIPHFQSLSLRNFRGFKKQEDIALAPLTFLVGPNSSGKSSIFDALLFLTQSEFMPGVPQQIPNWGGPLVDLGSFRDTIYEHKTNLTMEIGFQVSPYFTPARMYDEAVNQPMKVMFSLRTSKNDPIGHVQQIGVVDVLTNETLNFEYSKNKVSMQILDTEKTWSIKRRGSGGYIPYSVGNEIESILDRLSRQLRGRKAAWQRIRKFIRPYTFFSLIRGSERVSSGRGAPKRWYSVAERRFRLNYDFGPRVFDSVDPYGLEVIPSSSSIRRRRPRPKQTLASVLNELEIGSQIHDTKLSPYHLGINVRDSITGVISNLIDIGYGASQVIPILRAGLSSSEGPLYIEQPEIHLHPKAQGTLGDFLADVSRYRQVVIETHSVHMINRARIMVAKGDLPANHVIVNYVFRKKDGSHLVQIPILQNGDFGAEWPQGFFDERYEDTMLLLQLKSQSED